MRAFLGGLFVVLIGLLVGGIVHIVSLLALPYLAPSDAYARLIPLARPNAFTALDPADPAKRLPFQDPAFVYLACRFDVSSGPVRVRVPLAGEYVTTSFYSTDSVPFFAVNDRSSLGTHIDVELHGAEDADQKSDDAVGVIPVVAPEDRGFVVVRSFAPTPSLAASVKAALAGASCETES